MATAANAGEIKARLVLEHLQFMRAMKQAQNEMQQTKEKAKQLDEAMHGIGIGSAVIGGAVVGAVGLAVKTFANFEQSMARVKAISEANTDEFKQLEKAAMDLGQSSSFSASQVADGMGMLAAQGFKVNEIIGAMPAVLNLAAASGADLAQASDILGAAMNGFKITAQETGHAVDVMAKATNLGALDMNDLGESMKFIGPVAGAMKMSIEDVNAALVVMSNVGIRGSQAGTTLRQGLAMLAGPSKQAAELMNKLGIKISDAHGKMKSLPQIIGSMQKAFKGLTDEQKLNYLTTLVGTESASGFLALIDKGQKALEDYSAQLKNADGTAQKMADTMKDTLTGAWEQFTGTLETAGIKLGKEFAPMVRDLLQSVTGAVQAFNELDPAVAAIGLKSVAAAAGVAALGSALFVGVRALNTFRLALASNPWGLALLGVSALVGGIVAYNEAQDQASKVSLDYYNQLAQKQQNLQSAINGYEQLKSKLKLSTDEMLRYMDIQQEMQNTSDPKRLGELTKELDRLQKKSGLSKDEMAKLLDYNKRLIDQAPGTAQAISKSGNAFATNTKAAREYSQELIRAKQLELDMQSEKVEANLDNHLKNYKDAVKDVNAAIETWNNGLIAAAGHEYNIEQLNKRIAEAKKKGHEHEALALKDSLFWEKQALKEQQNKNAAAYEEYKSRKNALNAASQTLDKDKQVYSAINQNILAQVGLNAKIGQEKDAIKAAINAEEKKKDAIIKAAGGADKLNAKQKAQVKAIEDTIAKYKDAGAAIEANTSKQKATNDKINQGKKAAGDMAHMLSKDEVKNIKFTGDGLGKAQQITNELGKPVKKEVTIIQRIKNFFESIFSPKKHSGGLLYDVPVKRPKFHSGGSPSLSYDPTAPKLDEVDVRILRDEMVLTRGQQYNLFNMIRTFNDVQAKRLKEAAARDAKNKQTTAQPLVVQVLLDKAEVARALLPDINQELERARRQELRMQGRY